MNDEPLPKNIGPYTIVKSLGKGGMGEVFLAFDPKCQRNVALKRIRTDLNNHSIIKNRFLKEAIITSQLAHPAIVPIYSLHEDEGSLYYIMPYLEGVTLKELIKKTRKNEEDGSVPTFLRIFTTLCQAIAYAHSKGFLHRDLKPENIIVGTYGQVYILDWGLVKSIYDAEEEEEIENVSTQADLTKPGKLVGTLAYMSPERVLGGYSSISSDIYALGVIFYQLLTLHLPFKRRSVKEFKANIKKERLIEPIEIAPYRDIPPELSRSVKKCLAPSADFRYPSVDELISDIENYLEGRSDWFLATNLSIHKKSHWEFQEHVVIAKTALKPQWVSVMISKESFSGNTQLAAKVKISADGNGIGFLLSVPEALQRIHPLEGYCLWLSAHREEPSKLFRSTAEVMQFEDVVLPKEEWVQVRFEKVDHHIHCFINDKLIFSYISYLPLTGSHIGVLYRDANFEISDLSISLGSFNLKVSCLAIADAFLACKDYVRALAEYRRIGYAFPGRQEAREALFLAGITLLEQAKSLQDPKEKEAVFNATLLEFEKLRGTPGAPLEYLGKALTYETTGEIEEEIKCFALGLRRYPDHPLMHYLEEQILFRLHSRSKQNRFATYHFVLLLLTTLPHAINKDTSELLETINKQLESLFFIENPHNYLALQLAFWLQKPYVIVDLLKRSTDLTLIKNALSSLIYLGETTLAKSLIPEIAPTEFELFRAPLSKFEELAPPILKNEQVRLLCFHLKNAIDNGELDLVIQTHSQFIDRIESFEGKLELDSLLIWALLVKKDWKTAEVVFHKYPLDLLNHETSILHFLYGCFLYVTESQELAHIHFTGILDTPFPRVWCLATHYLFSKGLEPSTWLSNAFFYEKQELYRQLSLFYHCTDNQTLAKHYKQMYNHPL